MKENIHLRTFLITLLMALTIITFILLYRTNQNKLIEVESGFETLLPDDIEKIKSQNFPEGISSYQVSKYLLINSMSYAIFQKSSINEIIDGTEVFVKNSNNLRAGILVQGEDKKWQILLEIQDKKENEKNNPYDFWYEDQKYYLVIIDDDGVESGEGILKLFESIDLSSWTLTTCRYYKPEPTDFDLEEIQLLNELDKNDPLCQNIILNSDL